MDIYILGLEIWPNVPNFTLTEETLENYLICKGNESIQWYFRQYDGALEIKKV